MLVRDLKEKRELLVAGAIAVPALLTANLAIGLGAGIALHLLINTLPRVKRLRLRHRAASGHNKIDA